MSYTRVCIDRHWKPSEIRSLGSIAFQKESRWIFLGALVPKDTWLLVIGPI